MAFGSWAIGDGQLLGPRFRSRNSRRSARIQGCPWSTLVARTGGRKRFGVGGDAFLGLLQAWHESHILVANLVLDQITVRQCLLKGGVYVLYLRSLDSIGIGA
jgi:hypothetical protein